MVTQIHLILIRFLKNLKFQIKRIFKEHTKNYATFLNNSRNYYCLFDVFSTVHHSIELFHQPTLMHNFLYSLTICLLHYYPRHVSSINMPIFRRKIVFTQHLVSLLSVNVCTVHWLRVRSQPVYCADDYRERRYQMLCEYNFSSWRWAC